LGFEPSDTAYNREAFHLSSFALFAVFILAGSSFKLIDYFALDIAILSLPLSTPSPSSTKTSSLLLSAPF